MAPPLRCGHDCRVNTSDTDAPTMNNIDRERSPNHRRQALISTSVATLGLSLMLCISPVFGAGNGNSNGNSGNANGNGNTGTVKVHDAGTGLEAVEQNNEPYVCAFWRRFNYDSDERGVGGVASCP